MTHSNDTFLGKMKQILNIHCEFSVTSDAAPIGGRSDSLCLIRRLMTIYVRSSNTIKFLGEGSEGNCISLRVLFR
jgi:hypothetical protein